MDDLDNKNNILYRPDLELSKNYYADGKLNYLETQEDTSKVEITSENLQEQIELIKRSLLFVPGAIRPQTESILNLVYFLLIIIDKVDGDKDDVIYEIIKPETNPGIIEGDTITEPKPDINTDNKLDIEEEIKIPIDSFFKDHKPVTVLKQDITEEVKIKRNYSNSTLEITKFYISKIGDVLATYHAQVFANPQIIDYLEEVYKTSLVDYKDYVAHSILQTLLKSQQEKISKMRLYQKLYNQKECLTILKSLEYSKLTLLKMTGNAPKDPKLYYKHIQTIETEKKRLEKKMFEYYRYLDSSLDILNSCLNMHLTEGIAKAELHKINDIKETNK